MDRRFVYYSSILHYAVIIGDVELIKAAQERLQMIIRDMESID